MAKPTQEEQKLRWDNQVKAAIADGDLENLQRLGAQGLQVEDVQLWIWDNAPVALRAAMKLMADRDFMSVARGG
jgi:hypothetical protein